MFYFFNHNKFFLKFSSLFPSINIIFEKNHFKLVSIFVFLYQNIGKINSWLQKI